MDGRTGYARKVILTGGVSLVLGTIVFVLVHFWLVAHSHYPNIPESPANVMLVSLYLGGPTMRGVWSAYAVLPLALIPGAVASYGALRHRYPGAMLIAMILGIISALATTIGLMRWPGIHYSLGAALPSAGPEVRLALVAVYHATDTYIGSYIGGFIGETTFSVWSLLAGITMTRDRRFPVWIGRVGIGFALLFLVGAFGNALDFALIAVVADVGAVLFPLWLVLLGVSLIAFGGREP